VFNFQQRFRRSTAKAIFAVSSIHGGWWVEAGPGDVRFVDPEARESESAGAGQVEIFSFDPKTASVSSSPLVSL
jgi:hypothetical protein